MDVPDQTESLTTLRKILETLRAPGGCPWDREQTSRSLRPFIIEEAYELVEAIASENADEVAEELGDVLLQVVFQAVIWSEKEEFALPAVVRRISEKMIRRHPHVFGDETVDDADDVLVKWEQNKVEQSDTRTSVLEGVPVALPALTRAQRLQQRAASVGFDWFDVMGPLEKLQEELDELREAIAQRQRREKREGDGESSEEWTSGVHHEMGDVFFSVVNVARRLQLDAEATLQDATRRFDDRFRMMEKMASRQNRSLNALSIDELERLWQEAKIQLAEQ